MDAMETMDKLVSLCKRRGFIFPSSEIYGGLNGCWDYGPLGVELKRNIKEAWWQDMVTGHDDLTVPSGAPSAYEMVGLDCSILMNAKVWQASGHVGGFSDPMVRCTQCRKTFRPDKLWIVTVLPIGSVQNRDEVKDGLAAEITLTNPTETHSISFEMDIGSPPHQAQMAIREYAKANNIGFLKKFVCGNEGKPSRDYLWFAGRDATKGSEDDDFDCVIEFFSRARKDFGRRPCPSCHNPNSLSEEGQFNLMFETYVGAVKEDDSKTYLRPETAQGIFVNFKNVCDTGRVRIPFGIAQIGKAFRNEINPRHYTFRSREFEQMEIEFFCHPDTAEEWYRYWRDRRFQWYVDLGLKSAKLRLREHTRDELAHYARGCADVEYEFPFGVSELEGIANRTDFDLKQHTTFSGRDLQYFDDQVTDKDKRRYVPYVIEPSAGADRAALAFLCEAYSEDEVDGEPRVVMKFHPRLAPIKAAVLPLVKKDGMPEKAQEIYRTLKPRYNVYYDDKGAIGRRYRRQDEAGTPFGITIDGQTIADGTVTLRDRDSTEQVRIPSDRVAEELDARLGR
jgi:glycyl-tRNA synthetase